MKRIFLIVSVSLVGMVLLFGCSSSETHQHIEVYVTEVLEKNNEGIFEPTGYKKVNAMTNTKEIKKEKKLGKSEMKTIEDFYDTEENYIKTLITQSTWNDVGGEEHKEEIQEPSTILIPDEDIEDFTMADITEEEQEKVKEHIQSVMEGL